MGWLRDTFGRFGAAAAAPAPNAPFPAVSPPWRKLGNEALAQGNLAEAARCYEQGVLADPQDAALRLNHGFTLLEQGDFAAAVERLQQALALRRPGDDCAPQDAYFLLGRAQAALGQRTEAVASLDAALKASPDFAEALEEGVRVLDALKRHGEAADWMRRLVQLRPTNTNRLVLASQLRASDRDDEAVEVLDVICAGEPANVDAAVMRCAALKKVGRFQESLAEANRVLQMNGPTARFLVNRSVVLERMGRYEEALADIERALALEPTYRDGLVNHGTVLGNMLRLPEAIAAAEHALRVLGDDADVQFALSLALLVSGDLRRGWQAHERRVDSVVMKGKLLDLHEYPRWNGEDLRGRTIFLHGEQGIGDNIQFVRYANEIVRQAGTVIVTVSGVLEPLVARALAPNCRVLPQGSVLPHIDFHCPLMSLPAVLGTTLETIPANVPYLRAEPAAVEAWRGRLDPQELNVGIAWAGNAKHSNDHNRSMALATFRAIDTDGCCFLTAQPDVREADRPVLADWPRAKDLGRELRNFDDTAAYFEALDLIITVDTSVAHLAGALGRPVWILLPHVPDWRWLLDREDSPWYPTARLYRQRAAGDWSPVLARVRQDLAAMASARRESR